MEKSKGIYRRIFAIVACLELLLPPVLADEKPPEAKADLSEAVAVYGINTLTDEWLKQGGLSGAKRRQAQRKEVDSRRTQRAVSGSDIAVSVGEPSEQEPALFPGQQQSPVGGLSGMMAVAQQHPAFLPLLNQIQNLSLSEDELRGELGILMEGFREAKQGRDGSEAIDRLHNPELRRIFKRFLSNEKRRTESSP